MVILLSPRLHPAPSDMRILQVCKSEGFVMLIGLMVLWLITATGLWLASALAPGVRIHLTPVRMQTDPGCPCFET
ncbi:MAG TPA: hypothetical protein ENI65_07950 [Gammaproteobacteria bacterium]|nr:hypothetical protein [Gammaproteobacteria bacterium]